MKKKTNTKKGPKKAAQAVAQDAKAKVVDKTATTTAGGSAQTRAGVTKAKTSKAAGQRKPKRRSALDAAAEVLKAADKPMRAQELIAAMAEQGLWSSPAGKTPHATLYAAILREITTSVTSPDGSKISRFRKVDRGLFTFNEHSKR